MEFYKCWKKQTYYVVKDFINKRGSEVIPFQLKLLTC